MNCLESRRRLLASPRERTDDHLNHVTACPECSRFANELAVLDRKIDKAARVPVPEGLADRIVLAHGYPDRWHRAVAAAAAVLLVAISAVTLLPSVLESDEPLLAAETVGATHPAVAAISFVVDQEPWLLRGRPSLDRGLIDERLKLVGLALKDPDVSARYVGKCQIAGRDCDHLVLVTPEGHVSLVLMAQERATAPVLVSDRRMAALLSPAPSGAYIVVADSPKAVRRAQKLFGHV